MWFQFCKLYKCWTYFQLYTLSCYKKQQLWHIYLTHFFPKYFFNSSRKYQKTRFRSNNRRCSIEKGVKLISKETLARVFYCELCEICLFNRTPSGDCFWCFVVFMGTLKLILERNGLIKWNCPYYHCISPNTKINLLINFNFSVSGNLERKQ